MPLEGSLFCRLARANKSTPRRGDGALRFG